MDEPGEVERKPSPLQRVKKYCEQLGDDVTRELKEEVSENKNIEKAEGVASDLAEPETIGNHSTLLNLSRRYE